MQKNTRLLFQMQKLTAKLIKLTKTQDMHIYPESKRPNAAMLLQRNKTELMKNYTADRSQYSRSSHKKRISNQIFKKRKGNLVGPIESRKNKGLIEINSSQVQSHSQPREANTNEIQIAEITDFTSKKSSLGRIWKDRIENYEKNSLKQATKTLQNLNKFEYQYNNDVANYEIYTKEAKKKQEMLEKMAEDRRKQCQAITSHAEAQRTAQPQ